MSTVYLAVTPRGCEICHMGVKGMKWGVRKGYLTKDGQMTDKGKKYRDKYLTKRGKFTNRYFNAKIEGYRKKYNRSKDPLKKALYESHMRNLETDRDHEFLSSLRMTISDIHNEKRQKGVNATKAYLKTTLTGTAVACVTAAGLTAAGISIPISAVTAAGIKGGYSSLLANTAIYASRNTPIKHINKANKSIKISVKQESPDRYTRVLSDRKTGKTLIESPGYTLPDKHDKI